MSDTSHIQLSTNKVYGRNPQSSFGLIELPHAREIQPGYFAKPDSMINQSIDQSKHSIFGEGKLARTTYCPLLRPFTRLKPSFFGMADASPGRARAPELHGFSPTS